MALFCSRHFLPSRHCQESGDGHLSLSVAVGRLLPRPVDAGRPMARLLDIDWPIAGPAGALQPVARLAYALQPMTRLVDSVRPMGRTADDYKWMLVEAWQPVPDDGSDTSPGC